MLKTDLLFVYGRLLQSEHQDVASILFEYGKYWGRGYFSGRLFDLDTYPAAIYDKDGEDQVHGDIFQMMQPVETLQILDKHVGFGEAYQQPNEYIRRTVRVMWHDKPTRCWMYEYNRPLQAKNRISSGDYYLFLQGGGVHT